MPKGKLKLAYISPLPPERTGISFYSRELLQYLSNFYDITLIVDQEVVDHELVTKYDILDWKKFLSSFKVFDRVIYHFGNSPYHKHMLYLIEEIPGIVVLHDVFLSGLIEQSHYTSYYSNILTEEAYYSHGWSSMVDMKENFQEFLIKYPLNARVINNSLGIIIHNNYAFELIKTYFHHIKEENFAIIPQIREILKVFKGSSTSDLIVASFGHITPFKCIEVIIKAFALSEISTLPNARLCLVGQVLVPEYATQLMQLSEDLHIGDKVVITGYVSDEVYLDYLEKAFICVQLRKSSRGETSRAVLDILGHGKPLVVNFHGSLKEIPEDAAFFVSENPDPKEVAHAINTIYRDKNLKARLENKGAEYVKTFHSPEKVARIFNEKIEMFYKKNTLLVLIDKIQNIPMDECELKEIAACIRKNSTPTVSNPSIFVDVSAIAFEDLKTGIQRVVKAQLKNLLENPPKCYRIEPIRLTNEDGRWVFKYARKFTKGLLGIPDSVNLADALVHFKEGDIYYAPDFACHHVLEGSKAGVYDEVILSGVKVAFVVYDLLPIEFPQYFPSISGEVHAKWVKKICELSDLILCISQATLESLKAFAKRERFWKDDLRLVALHLGSDMKVATHLDGLSSQDLNLLTMVSNRPYFLMVSTLEPRKGHLQTIKAFEVLWKEGREENLIIVGKQGWMVEDLMHYIRTHPLLNKRLFWLGQVSDELLERLYKGALATILASEGEGFGLPIIESAHYGTPVIVRDIPVFKEVASGGAYYFPNTKDPILLARAIEDWLDLYQQGRHPQPNGIKWMSWSEHTEILKSLLLGLGSKHHP